MSDYIDMLENIPTPILSNVMNRMNCMDAAVKAVQQDVNMVGS
jgi:hypothetical protein